MRSLMKRDSPAGSVGKPPRKEKSCSDWLRKAYRLLGRGTQRRLRRNLSLPGSRKGATLGNRLGRFSALPDANGLDFRYPALLFLLGELLKRIVHNLRDLHRGAALFSEFFSFPHN